MSCPRRARIRVLELGGDPALGRRLNVEGQATLRAANGGRPCRGSTVVGDLDAGKPSPNWATAPTRCMK